MTNALTATNNLDVEKKQLLEKIQKNKKNTIAKQATSFLKKIDLSKTNNSQIYDMIDSGCDVNQADRSGWTLLAEAITREDVNLIGSLLEKGAKLDQRVLLRDKKEYRIPFIKFDFDLFKDIGKFIGFYAACCLGWAGVAVPLCCIGGLLTGAFMKGITIGSLVAVAGGSFTSVVMGFDKKFFENRPYHLCKLGRFDWTRKTKKKILPFEMAMAKGNSHVINALKGYEENKQLEKILQKEQKNEKIKNILLAVPTMIKQRHKASKEASIAKKATQKLADFDFANGTAEQFDELIASGANISALNKEHQGKLIENINKENPNIAQKLQKMLNSWKHTWGTIDWDKDSNKTILEKANALVTEGVNVNMETPDEYKNTPLTFAAFKQKAELVQLLIDHGADVNHQNKDGYTPLMAAVIKNNKEIVIRLVNAGADITIRNNKAESAFTFAQKKKNAKIIDILTKSPNNVVAKNNLKLNQITQDALALVRS